LVAIGPDEVTSYLEHRGILAAFSEYEYHPQQVEMLRAVTQALSEDAI
jgi:hypothetical protein